MAPANPASPTGQKLPPKKSLRIWVRNNGHVLRKKKKLTYVYPRTVEAAKDPFECASGKNKMFYLIAINLYPDSKILKPDDSESDTDVEETVEKDNCKSNDQDNQKNKTESQKVIKSRIKKVSSDDKPLSSADALKPHNNSGKESTDNFCGESTVKSQKEDASRRKFVSLRKISTGRPRGRPPKRSTLLLRKGGNENKKECSKRMIKLSSLSKKPETNPSNKIKTEGVVKCAVKFERKTHATIPSIISSLHKVIQNCSETGVVSFCLPKKTPQ